MIQFAKPFFMAGLLGLAFAGCSKEKPTVSGYDSTGNFVRDRGLSGGDVCPMDISEFAQACLAAGYETIFLHDCTVLCSEKLEPTEPTEPVEPEFLY
jgi:hypothetical protein